MSVCKSFYIGNYFTHFAVFCTVWFSGNPAIAMLPNSQVTDETVFTLSQGTVDRGVLTPLEP